MEQGLIQTIASSRCDEMLRSLESENDDTGNDAQAFMWCVCRSSVRPCLLPGRCRGAVQISSSM